MSETGLASNTVALENACHDVLVVRMFMVMRRKG